MELLPGLGVPHLDLAVPARTLPAALARRLPSGLKATLLIRPTFPLYVTTSRPVCASHTFTSVVQAVLGPVPTPTLLPEATRLPSGLKATGPIPPRTESLSSTGPANPLKVRSSWPVCASHTFTVRSAAALTRRRPSGLNATLWTGPVCPVRVTGSRPVWMSHTFTVRSAAALTRRRPSGLNATLWTGPVCPVRVKVSRPVWVSHTFTSFPTAAGQVLPVRAEDPTGDGAGLLTGRRIPDFDSPVPAGRGQPAPVGAERHAGDLVPRAP